MNPLNVSADGRHLERNGELLVPVVDTTWSAFADADPADWRSYARTRVAQGFNGVAISALPVLHDRTVRATARVPFAESEPDHYDYGMPNADYLAAARELTAIAVDEGLTPWIVVLWSNYVPGTLGSNLTPWSPMSDDERRAHVERIVGAFAEFAPVWIISGDDSWEDPSSAAAFHDALRQVRELDPESLITTHTLPDHTLTPAVLDEVDLYAYQSGHDVLRQDLCWILADRYATQPTRRPVINLEPAYEAHGRVNGLGRFSRDEIRRAIWWSIVGGASAGVGYGAHGLFSWHDRDGRFLNRAGTLEPFEWRAALRLSGADDAAFAGRLIADHALYRLSPAQGLLRSGLEGTLVAEGAGIVAVYLPWATDVELDTDLSDFRATGWDLATRSHIPATAAGASIAQLDVAGDVLLVFER